MLRIQYVFKIIFFIFFTSAFVSTKIYSQQPKKIKTIIVDAGHGGSDPGAKGEYEGSLHSQEKNITLAIATRLVAILKEELPGTNIIPTRTSDITQPVKEKAK